MVTLPSLILVSAAVLLGIYLGILYLRRIRPRLAVLGAHILMGLGGVEQVAILIRGAPSGVVLSGSLVRMALGLFAAAIFAGFTAPILAQRSRRNGEVMLAAHAGLGFAGFALLLFWISGL
jgi:hypothetical protein